MSIASVKMFSYNKAEAGAISHMLSYLNNNKEQVANWKNKEKNKHYLVLFQFCDNVFYQILAITQYPFTAKEYRWNERLDRKRQKIHNIQQW